MKIASTNPQLGFIHMLDVYHNKNDRDVSNRIASLELDILIDLTTHTYNGRMDIAGLKPANIIVNYLGYPGTTGCRAFDYSMVDAHVVPPELSLGFTENLIYLPYNYQSTSMPLTVAPCWDWEVEVEVGTEGGVDRVGGLGGLGGFASHRSYSCRRRLVDTVAVTPTTLSTNTNTNTQSHGTNATNDTNDTIETMPLERPVTGVSHPHETLLLDPKSLLICSFNAAKKFEPLSFTTWMNVLKR